MSLKSITMSLIAFSTIASAATVMVPGTANTFGADMPWLPVPTAAEEEHCRRLST